jgi:hypothetical protein
MNMSWFASSKDFLATVVAFLALLVSFTTVVLSRKQQQRTAYWDLYSVLMSDDLHRGRWLIYEIHSEDDDPNRHDDAETYYLIYRTLGVFDNLGMFVKRKIVPRELVLEVWHHPLIAMCPGAQIVRDHAIRTSPQPGVPWPELWALFISAKEYAESSGLACCGSTVPHRGRVALP